MKKIGACVLIVVCLSCFFTALAADVSGFEAHATIDLTPFKNDDYSATFSEITYSANISLDGEINAQCKNPEHNYVYRMRFYPEIEMTTFGGIEAFRPYFYIFTIDLSAPYGLVCVIGENRYLITVPASSNSQLTIGKELFEVLKEISSTQFTVKLSPYGTSSDDDYVYQLTTDDISLISRFVSDLEVSGIANNLTDDNIIIITRYN